MESLITITELYSEHEHIANEIRNRIHTHCTYSNETFAGGTNQVKSLEYIIFAFIQAVNIGSTVGLYTLHLFFLFSFLILSGGLGPAPQQDGSPAISLFSDRFNNPV